MKNASKLWQNFNKLIKNLRCAVEPDWYYQLIFTYQRSAMVYMLSYMCQYENNFKKKHNAEKDIL